MDIGDGAGLNLVDTFCYLCGMLSIDGDADAARVPKLWNEFRQLVLLPPTRMLPFLCKGSFKIGFVRNGMLHGSETRPGTRHNELTLVS